MHPVDAFVAVRRAQANARAPLYAKLFVMLITRKFDNWSDFRRFSEWLGCYTFVTPAKRQVTKSVADAIYKLISPLSATDFYFLWSVMSHVETNLNEIQQAALVTELQELIANEGAINV